jgi:aryl carrier-like protein
MDPVADAEEGSELPARLAAADPQERERLLRETVLDRVSEILSRPAMEEDSNFLENGLNSLAALELAKTLMNLTGLEVPLVAVVENPTSQLLGKFLAEEFESGGANGAPGGDAS